MGHTEPRNRILTSLWFVLCVLCAGVALANPPWTLIVNSFDPAPGATSYNLYLNDCDPAGPSAAPVGTVDVSGGPQTFTDLVSTDGPVTVCVRAVNSFGENPDPGPVFAETLGLPGTISNLTITWECAPSGPCSVQFTIP